MYVRAPAQRAFLATSARDLGRALVKRGIGEERRFLAGEELWHHDQSPDSIHLLIAGVVKVTSPGLLSGDEIADLVVPGEIANLGSVGPVPCCYGTGIALTRARVISCAPRAFRELVASDPELCSMVLGLTAIQATNLRMRSASLTAGGVPGRLARVFFWLAWRMGIADARGTFIPLRLTRKELAGLVGCRVETSIRILGAWVRDELIALTREGVILLAPERVFEFGHEPGLVSPLVPSCGRNALEVAGAGMPY